MSRLRNKVLLRSAFVVLVVLIGMVAFLPEPALAQLENWCERYHYCITQSKVGIGTGAIP